MGLTVYACPPTTQTTISTPPSSYTGEAHVCDLLRRGLALRRAAFCKSFEGCRADGRVVLPNGSALAVQIKTTRGLAKGTTNQYKFQSTRGYEECLVICCAVSESKFWLIPGEALSKVSGLTITTGGKWDRYASPGLPPAKNSVLKQKPGVLNN